MRRRKKLVELFTAKEALSHSMIEVDEKGMCACPFHRGEDREEVKKVMKHYKELNAVACLNPKCVHYQELFRPIDLMASLMPVPRPTLELFAEEMLIRELEAYRATGIEPIYLTEEEEEELYRLKKAAAEEEEKREKSGHQTTK